ncbi:FAD-dependent oxidoreductase [Natronolimnobius baerhuensis]|uniref:Oxidoreductase n=1 Tax=Natronolimnobius baerhuensis TaxID=253108 RepID=A0A202E8C6_9EURY|nr:FAD-dependent oxidoreductase [Natronolimnobius baerhuensis]OVE84398.1 oxidoreductase [Natronolimnobius baerhuensis]
MDGTPVTVVSVRDVGPETVALDLETPAEFDAAPGQFVLLRAVPGEGAVDDPDDDDVVERHYTLSSPSVADTFEITVGVDPEGDLSPWLADLEGGETVHIDGPFGTITYDGDEDGDVVAIAGGPGVGPAIAIAEAAHDAGHDAVVIYQDDAPAHRERLEALADDDVPVELVAGDDREALTDAIETHLEAGQVYAFGFDAFVTTVAETIEDAGGDADGAHIENFG